MLRVQAAHTRSVDALVALLNSSFERGLDTAEAQKRLRAHGPNIVDAREPSRWRRILIDQMSDLMTILLVAAGAIAAWIGEPQDALAIAAILVLNVALGIAQTYQAERSLARLREMAAPTARVRRSGRVRAVPARDLVPGDVVLLEAGNRVSADLRIVEAHALAINESILTGEPQAVAKSPATLETAELPLGDRSNLAYAGTTVDAGRGLGVVVATGAETELGRIASLLHETEPTATPLQRRLALLARRLVLLALGICAIVLVTGWIRGEPFNLVLLTAVGLAVAAIPESLPTVVTVALALGTRRMTRVQALVRHLSAVETLGSVTVICADKTGTLTQNRMRGARFWAPDVDLQQAKIGSDASRRFWQAMAICNDVTGNAADGWHGDPTEVALVEAAEARGFSRPALTADLPRIGEIPFSSERGWMSTSHGDEAGIVVFSKGGPEAMLHRCRGMASADGTRELDRERIAAAVSELTADGSRVLALAYRLDSSAAAQAPSAGDCLLGLVALTDPARPEAKPAVALCRSAGIRPIMITGDHPSTAGAIASEIGILTKGEAIMTGPDLDRLDPAELAGVAARVSVYARVTPEQKLAIVTALQHSGAIVAMTGDGVNDAPAIKRADVGIAMGGRGTDVAREAADLVLLDDNFATIVNAVREGRRIIENVRKFIRYVLTANIGEVVTLLLAPLVGLPLPLLPVQILWINLVTDGLPGLALTAEPEEPSSMRQPPRSPEASPVAGPQLARMLAFGILLGGLSLTAAALGYTSGSPHWRTMTFTVLTLGQLFLVLGLRSHEALASIRSGSNVPLYAVIGGTTVLHVITVHSPAMNAILAITPLTAAEWVISAALAMVVLGVVEFEKRLTLRAQPLPSPGARLDTA